jgi:hypothetical protein
MIKKYVYEARKITGMPTTIYFVGLFSDLDVAVKRLQERGYDDNPSPYHVLEVWKVLIDRETFDDEGDLLDYKNYKKANPGPQLVWRYDVNVGVIEDDIEELWGQHDLWG